MSAIAKACQRGFVLPSAIFILLVLAALGVAILNISSSQSRNALMDELSARAYQAARAGLEWGLYRRLIDNSTCDAAGTIKSFALPSVSGSTLGEFSVTVTCTSVVAINKKTMYRIESTACNNQNPVGGSCPGTAATRALANYVERKVQATMMP